MSNLYAEFQSDKAAVGASNFCAVWPTAKAILQQLVSLISNPLAKIAISTVIGAGDGYCGSSDSGSSPVAQRLSAAGLQGLDKLSPNQIAALGGLSDSELGAFTKLQGTLQRITPMTDVGSGCF